MTAQLALEIPVRQQPQPTVFLRVDEIGLVLHGSRETHTNWELYRQRHAARLTTIAVRFPGDLVDVACDDRAHAQWLAAWLHSLGVPKISLKIHGGQS